MSMALPRFENEISRISSLAGNCTCDKVQQLIYGSTEFDKESFIKNDQSLTGGLKINSRIKNFSIATSVATSTWSKAHKAS